MPDNKSTCSGLITLLNDALCALKRALPYTENEENNDSVFVGEHYSDLHDALLSLGHENPILIKLARLEKYRKDIQSSQSSPGSHNHVIQVCQAIVADGEYDNRNSWTKLLS